MKILSAASKFQNPVDSGITLFTLLILVGYTFAKFWVVPYAGIYINSATGQVETVYTVSNPKQIIEEGDLIVSVGDVNWKSDFRPNLYRLLFEDAVPGQTIPISVIRDGEIKDIEWEIPGINSNEVWGRVIDIWWLAYFFFFAGVATFILIRPKDLRWWLLILFYYLTAIWLIAGTVSSHHVWLSAIVMRSVLWLCIPVYLHLHWVFPVPLKKLPVYIWIFLYLGGIALAVSEWLLLLPLNAYFIAALIALGGTVLLIILHYFLQPSYRSPIKLLVVTLLFAIVPLLIVFVISFFYIQPLTGALALLTLPALPAVYFYTAYRRPTGWLELRTNRIATYYLFLLLLIILTIFMSLIVRLQNLPENSIIFNAIIVLVASLITAFGFRPFQRFVERKLLGIPVPYDQIVEHFTTHIVTSSTRQQLVQTVKEEIVPSLLIKQSVLLLLKDQGHCDVLYVDGVTKADVPTRLGFSPLDKDFDEHIQSRITAIVSWAYLVIPLRIENKLIGLWLLGKHDPDDEYRQEEITLLKLLANQISIALTNIQQSEQLHALYKNSIDHQEVEKANLARLLHDEILNNLALLSKAVSAENPHLESIYQSLVTRIRQTMVTLRPKLLDFGLWAALDELIDNLNQLHQDEVAITFDVNYSIVRYSVEVEQNMLRIVQLAIENALDHAEAHIIQVQGQLESGYIQFTVADDGVGFAIDGQLNFNQLRNNNHFGLAHMHERASFIDAALQVDSILGKGTCISLSWQAANQANKI